MNETLLVRLLVFFPKAFAAVIGAIFALVLSGDIDTKGRLQLSWAVILKFTFTVTLALYGSEATVEFFHLEHFSSAAHGFITLCFALFGMLIVGVIYQSIALLKGKSLIQIVAEIGEALKSIFRSK